MAVFITSDTHLGHHNMVKLCGRPENFEDLIVKGWRECVSKNDTVIHLGDFCFKKRAEWHYMLVALPGRKILVKGNHDNESITWYERNGWDHCVESLRTQHAYTNFLFTHRPQPLEVLGDAVNIHGHCHNNGHRDDEVPKDSAQHYLVGVDVQGFAPVLLLPILHEIVEGGDWGSNLLFFA